MVKKGEKLTNPLAISTISRTGDLRLWKGEDIDLEALSDPLERMVAAFAWAKQDHADYRYVSQVKPYFNWAIEKDSGLLIKPDWLHFANEMKQEGRVNHGTIKNWCGRSRKLYKLLIRDQHFKEFYKDSIRQWVAREYPDNDVLLQVKPDTAWASYREDIMDAVEYGLPVKDTRIVREEAFNWLTPNQSADLILLPNTASLRGLRDRAMFALAIFTGIRRTELNHLLVRNLSVSIKGENRLVLEALPGHVKSSGHLIKGRDVAWGELETCLDRFVYPWLDEAGIRRDASGDDDFVFRGIKGKTKIMPGPMSLPVLGARLKKHRLTINGVTRYVTPHALRRTYAQSQKDAGVRIVDIARNMGHESTNTTFRSYLLDDAKSRRGRYAMPKNFMKIMDKKRKEKQATKWIPSIKPQSDWADKIMRRLESEEADRGFWLKEMTRGATDGQRANISTALTKLKASGKVKKYRLKKTAGLWIQDPKRDPPSRLIYVDRGTKAKPLVPPITHYPVEVD